MSDLYNPAPSQIVMYVTEYCPDCRRARAYFDSRQIPYLKVDVDKDAQAAQFVRSLNNGNRSVPTIIFPDGGVMVEPGERELDARFA